MKRKPILCLDFDGVLHSYTSGWKGAHCIPDPAMPGAGVFLLRAMRQFSVAVYSSRSKSLRGRMAMRRYIRDLVRDTCFQNSDEMEATWKALRKTPIDWTPWTHGDVYDVADDLAREIQWPWFKPPALMTIDDRAVQFRGEWPEIADIAAFKPWKVAA